MSQCAIVFEVRFVVPLIDGGVVREMGVGFGVAGNVGGIARDDIWFEDDEDALNGP